MCTHTLTKSQTCLQVSLEAQFSFKGLLTIELHHNNFFIDFRSFIEKTVLRMFFIGNYKLVRVFQVAMEFIELILALWLMCEQKTVSDVNSY